jgi:hypothetical protein
MRPDGFWRSCGLPVLVSTGVFCGLNAAWKSERWGNTLAGIVPYPVMVFLLGGSGLALFFIAREVRAGRLTRRDLGLELAGWGAPQRLAGVALLVIASYGQFLLLQYQLAGQPARPTWGDYSFNYFVCLEASLAELLVFLSINFCLVDAWLRRRGTGAFPAAAAAAVLASVGFGLYHYTHEARWHAYVVPLIGEMLLTVIFFRATGNFWLTFLAHNALAAGGFTAQQYSPTDPLNFEGAKNPFAIGIMAAAFLLPALYFHWLEWRGAPAAEPRPAK